MKSGEPTEQKSIGARDVAATWLLALIVITAMSLVLPVGG